MKLTTYYPNGKRYIVEYRRIGRRQGKVSIYDIKGEEISTLLYDHKQMYGVEYWQNGLLHNFNGPARVKWYDYGRIGSIEYWQNGCLHNLPGLAHITVVWYINGQLCEYLQNGPVYTLWDDNGQLLSQW